MAGVRGFADANLQMNGDKPVWNQLVSPEMTTEADHLNPWYINYLGGEWNDATQCMYAGSNGWTANHAAWNFGTNDHWALNNTPYSIGYYEKKDIPIQWALADGWVVGDMYQEAVIASTSPNRAQWASGSINVPGGPQSPDQGGNPYIDNNETPGCEPGGINCYPLKWETTGEYLEKAGVSWSVFQDADNFDDNPYAWFKQFQDASKGTPLYNKGMKGMSMDSFYEMAANGTLPEVSYIIGPAQLSEHPPYSPRDGGWLQRKIADAVIKSPKYSKTALIVSYDETGGWADHLDPYRSPDGTPGEWLDDPYGEVGHTFAGPGFRVPFYIISPWTRHGGVYTEYADHNSQILFLEKWQEAKGRDIETKEMVPWRRENMGDLVGAFDFENPDFTVVELPDTPEPHKNNKGDWDGSSYCQSQHKETRPPVPYTGNGAIEDMETVVNDGFKSIRGKLTEGRYLTFELLGAALTAQNCGPNKRVNLTPATAKHEKKSQRFVVHAVEAGSEDFTITSVASGDYICNGGKLCSNNDDAVTFTITFAPSKGYSLEVKGTGKFLGANSDNSTTFESGLLHWQVYSVNY
jgi:phospholipase C